MNKRNSIRISIIIMILSIIFTNVTIAAPLVNSISGTIDHGQSVIAYGSGFGSKAQASPVLWDTVDNQSTYASVSNGDTIPTGGSNPWGENTYSATKYRTTIADQRGQSTACYYASNSTKNHLGMKNITGATYLYVSWWFKTNTSISGTSHSSKVIRVNDSDDPTLNQTFSWTQMQAYVWQSPNYYGNTWKTLSPTINAWHFFEAMFDSRNRTYTLRVDGTTLYSAISWSGATSTVLNQIGCIGWDSGGSAPIAITSWMDDIYVDNTPSRIVIGNNTTYASSTHLEMQIPMSWSANGQTITFKVNQGSFADGATAYLYVFDSNGSVNAIGYPITFGQGSSSGDTTPPTVPTGISTSIIQ